MEYDFFKQLSGVTNSSPNSYVVHKRVFFTTNYDNAVEEYWVRYKKYKEFDLGFRHAAYDRSMDADEFVNNYLCASYEAMQLVKLHGSVNWTKNRDDKIEEHSYGSSRDSVRFGLTSIEVERMQSYWKKAENLI